MVNNGMNSFPVITNMDDLAMMSDDELFSHLRNLFNGRNHGRSFELQKLWETEIAFAQREVDIRQQRRVFIEQLHASMFNSDDQPETISDEFVNSLEEEI